MKQQPFAPPSKLPKESQVRCCTWRQSDGSERARPKPWRRRAAEAPLLLRTSLSRFPCFRRSSEMGLNCWDALWISFASSRGRQLPGPLGPWVLDRFHDFMSTYFLRILAIVWWKPFSIKMTWRMATVDPHMATATSTNRHDHLQPHLLGSRMQPFQQNATTGSYPSSKHVPFLASRTRWQLFFFSKPVQSPVMRRGSLWSLENSGGNHMEQRVLVASEISGITIWWSQFGMRKQNQHLFDFVVGKHTLNLTYLSYIYICIHQNILCNIPALIDADPNSILLWFCIISASHPSCPRCSPDHSFQACAWACALKTTP